MSASAFVKNIILKQKISDSEAFQKGSNLMIDQIREDKTIQKSLKDLTLFFKNLISRVENSLELIIKLQDGIEEKYYRFQNAPIQIGRSVLCNIPLADRYVSREHARILLKSDQYFLTDLGSLNGTLLNKTRLIPQQEYPLTSGDTIQIERFKMHILLERMNENPKSSPGLNLISLYESHLNDFLQINSESTITAEYKITPQFDSCFIKLDFKLAQYLINKFQRPEEFEFPAHLNESQKRIFENILLELEDFINHIHFKAPEPKINFVQVLALNLPAVFDLDQKIIVFEMKLDAGYISGIIHICIPYAYLEKLEFLHRYALNFIQPAVTSAKLSNELITSVKTVDNEFGGDESNSENARIMVTPLEMQKTRVREIMTLLKLEIGTFMVTAYDLLSLGINSQLVLQNIKLALIDQALIGNIRLRIPYSNEYYWTGTLSSDKTNYLIRIREMIKSSPLKPDPAMRIFLLPHSPPETEQIQFSQLNQFLGEFPSRDFASKKERLELLKGIKLNLVIEIGQIKLKISDIMKLNPGQIIKIGKQLSQKVNLTIENQLIASGILYSSAEDLIIKITQIQD